MFFDSVSSIYPGTLAVSCIKQLAVESSSFVDHRVVEVKIEDSPTRKTLGATVNKRVGNKGW